MRIADKGFACIILTAVVVLSSAFGCGRRASHTRAPASPVEEGSSIPLPDWAPENPSPEFLRAARVLKPLPEERLQGFAGKGPEGTALLQRYRGTMPASYEFFGALDDRQIERFRRTKEIRIPVKSLSPKQRAALDRWFETWRVAMKGMRPEFEDYLLLIYRMGGREDLSNVDIGFTAIGAGGGHVVHIYFWIRTPDGKLKDFGTAFAQI